MNDNPPKVPFMKAFSLFLVSFFCIAITASAQQTQEEEVIQLSDPVEQTEDYRVFGSVFDGEPETIPLEDLVGQADTFDKKTVTTEGTIAQVCQKKGCFFMLESGGQQARIRFKDYGFFIPTDTAGKEVRLNGTFLVTTLAEEQARHFAEDAGTDPETITGPQKEYGFMATSVMIFE